jgi:hypothetical protein
MYPVELLYSHKAHSAWQDRSARDEELKHARESADAIAASAAWEVTSWDELREAVSFLTLMNKRHVLYFRGQGVDPGQCLPVLFRKEWSLEGCTYSLNPGNRGEYYAKLRDLRAEVLSVALEIGTPRRYVLEHVPAATAAILQHYELWPTHFIDVTRSLPIAVSFAENASTKEGPYVFVFAMPDLRGSITSDMDQQLTLARLEAICPPAAKRPHHQDAYLVSRFPEPPGSAGPGDPTWKDWEEKTDLMRRVVAKFRLKLQKGQLPGTPRFDLNFLLPDPNADEFGSKLRRALLPDITRWVGGFPGSQA